MLVSCDINQYYIIFQYKLTVAQYEILEFALFTKTIFLSQRSHTVPNPPTFDILDIGDNHVNVSWEPSRSGNPGSVFYVQYRPRGE